MTLRRIIPFALVSVLALAPLSAAPKAAPDVALSTGSGAPIRLADLKGKVVLLDFWASWCVPCRRSFPQIDALHRELAGKGLAVVAVNVDEQVKNANAFLEQFPHTMPIAFDPKGAVAQAFDLQAMPSSILIDRSGQIRFSHVGYTDKTIGQFRTEVMQLLTEAQ